MRAIILSAALAASGAAALAQDVALKEQNGLRYACGGVGVEGREALAALRPQANVEFLFVSARREVKMYGFGFTSLDPPGASEEERRMQFGGSAAFMSPEQIGGGAPDARSDVFSFGALLYLMTCGRPPFGGPAIDAAWSAILKDRQAPVWKFAAGAPPGMDDAIGRCLRKKPEQRATLPECLCDYETEQFHWNHAIAGALLAYKWKLPDELVCCILHHHLGLRALVDPQLGRTPVAAVALSALLPDLLRQNYTGLEQLVLLQQKWPAFNLATLGDVVDREHVDIGLGVENSFPLSRRCQQVLAGQTAAALAAS